MTHPKHPPRPRDTRSLIGSLALAVVMLIIVMMATSCAPVPRAIIPPKAEIAKLDVAPVANASGKTRAAVRDVSRKVDVNRAAADRVSDDADKLKEAVDKAKYALHKTKEDYATEIAAIEAIADSLLEKVRELQASLDLTSIARDIAIQTIDDQDKEIGYLTARVAAQAAQIDHSEASQNILREQVETLSALPDKLAIAEDKLEWWRWRFAPVTLGILTLLILSILYRPRIPFLP
jgi:hypothetical protein